MFFLTQERGVVSLWRGKINSQSPQRASPARRVDELAMSANWTTGEGSCKAVALVAENEPLRSRRPRQTAVISSGFNQPEEKQTQHSTSHISQPRCLP
jgi:hypothetical protein